MNVDAGNIIVALFSAGGLAFATASYRAFRDWREGTWKRRDSAIADLEKWRKDADDAREWESVQHQWWRGWAGRLEYVILTRLGEKELPTRLPYPERPAANEGQKP